MAIDTDIMEKTDKAFQAALALKFRPILKSKHR